MVCNMFLLNFIYLLLFLFLFFLWCDVSDDVFKMFQIAQIIMINCPLIIKAKNTKNKSLKSVLCIK